MKENSIFTPEQKAAVLEALNDPKRRDALISFLKSEELRLAELRRTQASQ